MIIPRMKENTEKTGTHFAEILAEPRFFILILCLCLCPRTTNSNTLFFNRVIFGYLYENPLRKKKRE